MKHLLITAAAVIGLSGVAWANPTDIMTGRIEIQLRQAGLDPASAHWGAWAALHNPRSDCGIYANMISGQADMPGGLGGDASHSTESDVMVVEREKLCTEAGAKKGLAEAQRRIQEAQRQNAKDWGVPESWEKTGFHCNNSGCYQNKN